MAGRTGPGAGAGSDLHAALAILPGLARPELVERWTAAWDAPPPARLRAGILRLGLAWKLQADVHGGLSHATGRRLARINADLAAGRPVTPAVPALKPGTRLLREWHGRVHEVIVAEDGVQWRGETWPSLSAVAREITGTRWSGPAFFGLKDRA